MAKKAAKRAAKKKPATKKATGKQGKTSAKVSAKQAANDFGIPVALHDIKDALAEIKSLLQQLLWQQEQPARFVPCPPYQPTHPGPVNPMPQQPFTWPPTWPPTNIDPWRTISQNEPATAQSRNGVAPFKVG